MQSPRCTLLLACLVLGLCCSRVAIQQATAQEAPSLPIPDSAAAPGDQQGPPLPDSATSPAESDDASSPPIPEAASSPDRGDPSPPVPETAGQQATAQQTDAAEGGAQDTATDDDRRAAPRAPENTTNADRRESQLSTFDRLLWWLGKFHPPAISFPVGLLAAGALAELLYVFTSREWFSAAARFCSWVAGITAPLVAMLGWFYSMYHPTSLEWVLSAHQWLGGSTAVMAVVALALCEMAHARGQQSLRVAYRVALWLAAGLVAATGFFGGALIYGIGHYQWPAQTADATSDDEAEAVVVVEMTEEWTFEPRRVTISQGQSVKWTNPSSVYHTVTADPEKANDPSHVKLPEDAEPFDSGRIETGQRYTYTFQVPGMYRYFCIPHERAGMIGEVEVKPNE